MVINHFKIILDKSIFDENIIHIVLNYYWKILDKSKVLLHWIDINNLKWVIYVLILMQLIFLN